MKLIRRLKPGTVFKCMVLPSVILCCVFRDTWFVQLPAALAVCLWAAAGLINATDRTASEIRKSISEKNTESRERGINPKPDEDRISEISERITEMLKAVYPKAVWKADRTEKPENHNGEETWGIRTENTGNFNCADITIHASGEISAVMINRVPLESLTAGDVRAVKADTEAQTGNSEADDRKWYEEQGSDSIVNIINDLSSQGYRYLLIRENGDISVRSAGRDKHVSRLEGFPPKNRWKALPSLFDEDDIKAVIWPDGLKLSW